MNTAFSVLEELENNSSKLVKQQILTSNLNNIELRDILDAALNYRRRFFMKKWKTHSAEEATASHADFLTLLESLEHRSITGNAAISATEAFFSQCSPQQTKWYTRTLQQDLKIGVSVDTAIKCGFDIPKFEVQLATDGHKCKKLGELLKRGCTASRKLDGYRCLAVINKGEITLYSRNGTEYENFPLIKETLSTSFPQEQLVLDGEIVSNNFNAMQQTAFASKRGTAVGDVVFNVFDYIPFHEWHTDAFITSHKARIKQLKALLSNNKCIQLVEHLHVSTYEEVLQLERDFISQGFEGVMLNPDMPYYRGRKANSMLKFKTMLSMECKVIDFYEGEPDSRHQGSLGGVIVIQEDNGQECRIGSGFSDEERAWIWQHKDSVKFRILEAKYQELTPDGKMRFPTKFRWRTDKDENHIS